MDTYDGYRQNGENKGNGHYDEQNGLFGHAAETSRDTAAARDTGSGDYSGYVNLYHGGEHGGYAPEGGGEKPGECEAPPAGGFYEKYRHIMQAGYGAGNPAASQPEQWRPTAGEAAWQPGAGADRQASLRHYRKEKDAGNRFTALALALCMVVSGVFGFFGSSVYNHLRNVKGESTGSAVLYQSVIRHVATGVRTDEAMAVEETAAMVKQAVVEITTETAVRGGYFGQYISQGAGSGVIVTQDGYIVTNYHVIEGAGNITVRLPDGKTHTAQIVGTDPDSDLAVLKIQTSGLTPAVLGDSSSLQVGQTTLAVGNPLGELGGTVTSGIISALDREISIDGQTMALLQTDAAINPGNSGGGLFNLYGELIGIVNAKSSGSDIEGLGFAIPVNTAKKVIEDLIQIGYVRGRVSAGLEVVNIVTAREAMRYQVSQTGLYISKSNDKQLQTGDRIIGVNGATVSDFTEFRAVLNKCHVGDTITITVQRGNERVNADIVLTEMKP